MFQKKRNTFHGGVHPYEGKELSKDNPSFSTTIQSTGEPAAETFFSIPFTVPETDA